MWIRFDQGCERDWTLDITIFIWYHRLVKSWTEDTLNWPIAPMSDRSAPSGSALARQVQVQRLAPSTSTSSVSDQGWTTTPLVNSNMDLVTVKQPSDLQVVLRTKHHDAFYNSASKELSLHRRAPLQSAPTLPSAPDTSSSAQPLVPRRQSATSQHELTASVCPMCLRSWPLPSTTEQHVEQEASIDPPDSQARGTVYEPESPSFVAPNYFRLLAEATSVPPSTFNTRPSTPSFTRNRFETASGSSTPEPASRRHTGTQGAARSHASTPEPIDHGAEVDGYYARFFIEIKKLGHGARGQVFLCQHVLNTNKLGKYAIKKIPVGDHAQTLLNSLNEVHLMESLHHPHLIHYQHAWIERCQLSPFAPRVPTLFVLMMAANGGSLADWISARAGDMAENDSPRPSNTASPVPGALAADVAPSSRSSKHVERLKAALRQRRASRNDRQEWLPRNSSGVSPGAGINGTGVGVHLLREEEIYSLLKDMASGLGFLHDKGILHLDIKPANVLLHWDEDALIPRAMLSDFGSSLLLHDNWRRTRSGHTGTMDYMSPETVLPDLQTGQLKELSSKADIWSLGMILHLLLFFSLPFPPVEDITQLRVEMHKYTGFSRRTSPAAARAQRTDGTLLGLLERMLQTDPKARPSCKEILHILSTRPTSPVGSSQWSGTADARASRGSVSLALYRPSALRRLPSAEPHLLDQATPHTQQALDNRPLSFTERVILPLLGVRDLTPAGSHTVHTAQAVVVAFVKSISPYLVLETVQQPVYLSQGTRLHASRSTKAALALINLLAIVELAYSLSSRPLPSAAAPVVAKPSTVSFTCSVLHSAVLLALILTRPSHAV